jgi:hypothetical protein
MAMDILNKKSRKTIELITNIGVLECVIFVNSQQMEEHLIEIAMNREGDTWWDKAEEKHRVNNILNAGSVI